MLAWTVYLSFLGAALLFFVPRDEPRLIRWTALLTAAAGLFLGLNELLLSGSTHGFRSLQRLPWIPALGIEFHLGVDGISLTLVVLTGIAAVCGILFSWNVDRRLHAFFASYLVLIGAVYGVFLSFDLFLLFAFYELAIIPKYFLIAIWGSTRREYGAMKLVLYSLIGSGLVLIGMVAAYVVAGAKTMNLIALAQVPFPEPVQKWIFPLVFIGFAFLAGLWPFHTWAPTGHVAAPTGASMLLAGVVMKLGAYGAFRVGVTLFPIGVKAWQDQLGLLAVIGIVYGAMVAWIQRDFKFVIGYSSVSHMGFALLGLLTLNEVGLSGAVLQMFSHGIIAGLLFGVVGRMVYDRTHTRDLTVLQAMRLAKTMPFAAGTFIIAALASMGLPGFSGFVAELSVLVGAWGTFPTYAVLGGLGVVMGAVYTLRALQQAFFTEHAATQAPLPDSNEPMPPISVPERLGAVILIASTLVIGLFPRILLDPIVAALSTSMFAGLRKGGMW